LGLAAKGAMVPLPGVNNSSRGKKVFSYHIQSLTMMCICSRLPPLEAGYNVLPLVLVFDDIDDTVIHVQGCAFHLGGPECGRNNNRAGSLLCLLKGVE
jgi:hypothetical protein